MQILVLCKFTPLEFETLDRKGNNASAFGVNLLRWSLKPHRSRRLRRLFGVNLLRWSLKRSLPIEQKQKLNEV